MESRFFKAQPEGDGGLDPETISPAASKMERRMAVLFLLALGLIVWQASRTAQIRLPSFEVVTKVGERLSPVAVPSWRLPLEPPEEGDKRLPFLVEHSLSWPGSRKSETGPSCLVFVRISSQHWALRTASLVRLQRWVGRAGREPLRPWQLLHLPVESFLDDDDSDGDPLDDGELRKSGPGADVEAFCKAGGWTPEELQ